MLYLFFLFEILCLLEPTSAWTNRRPTQPPPTTTRREVLEGTGGIVTSLVLFWSTPIAAVAEGNVKELQEQIKAAREQLSVVPKLIDEGKWDSVRAVLIEPPLADCWAKTGRPLLLKYAEALGDTGGDELAAIEAKEEAISHLRYLDMAVYNNVFNPISTVGKTGSTETLIKSYYEDPIREFKASAAALDELVNLSQ